MRSVSDGGEALLVVLHCGPQPNNHCSGFGRCIADVGSSRARAREKFAGLHNSLQFPTPAGVRSRRPKQPEMHSALGTPMRPELDLQPGTMNLYWIFILRHPPPTDLWMAQSQMSQYSREQQPPLAHPIPHQPRVDSVATFIADYKRKMPRRK